MNETISNKKTFSQIGLTLFIGTLIIYAAQYLFEKIASAVPFISQNGDLYFIVCMLPMYIIAYPIIFFLFKRIPVTMATEQKKMKPGHIIAAFFIAYAATLVCNLIGTLITSVIGNLKGSEVENVLLTVTSSINPITTLFVVVICAPIMEELLFRKALISRTAQYGEGMSIVLSGITFGLFHGNLNQFAYAFVLGIFFGFIYVKTKNIVYPIILHIIINFIGSFLGSIMLEKTRYMEYTAKVQELTLSGEIANESAMAELLAEYGAGPTIFTVYSLALYVIAIIGAILFFKNKKKFTLQAGEVTIEKGARFKTMIINLGMILYCIFWIGMILLQLFPVSLPASLFR